MWCVGALRRRAAWRRNSSACACARAPLLPRLRRARAATLWMSRRRSAGRGVGPRAGRAAAAHGGAAPLGRDAAAHRDRTTTPPCRWTCWTPAAAAARGPCARRLARWTRRAAWAAVRAGDARGGRARRRRGGRPVGATALVLAEHDATYAPNNQRLDDTNIQRRHRQQLQQTMTTTTMIHKLNNDADKHPPPPTNKNEPTTTMHNNNNTQPPPMTTQQHAQRRHHDNDGDDGAAARWWAHRRVCLSRVCVGAWRTRRLAPVRRARATPAVGWLEASNFIFHYSTADPRTVSGGAARRRGDAARVRVWLTRACAASLLSDTHASKWATTQTGV